MVFVSRNGGFERIFRNLHKSSAADQTPILIFVSKFDVDAICASKILSFLLLAGFVPFKIIPVADVQQIVSLSVEFQRSRFLFFVNCIGREDVSTVLSLPGTCVAYVIDCRRPYHLENVFDNEQVIIFDDGYLHENRKELQSLFFQSQRSGVAEPEGYENSETASNQFNQPQSKAASQPAEEDQPGESDLSGLLAAYYANSFYGASSSSIAYSLCSALSKETNDALWCGILGSTVLWMERKISFEEYEAAASSFSEEVLRLNPHRPSSSANAGSDGGQQLKGSFSEDYVEGRISTASNELELFLLRQWNLRDAISHSDYFAPRLGVWRERGMQKLHLMLAKMAVPLRDATQQFSHLAASLQEEISHGLRSISAENGFTQGTFTAFVRSFSYSVQASNCDAVHSLLALLDSPPAADRPEGDSAFHRAFLSLETGSGKLAEESRCTLQNGFSLAIAVQRSLLREASALLSRQLIKQFRKFRLIVLREPHSPSFVLSLGNFVLAAIGEFGGRTYLPLLIATTAETETFRLQVITDASQAESHCDFASLFSAASAALGSSLREFGFERSTVLVPAERLMPLIAKVSASA